MNNVINIINITTCRILIVGFEGASPHKHTLLTTFFCSIKDNMKYSAVML